MYPSLSSSPLAFGLALPFLALSYSPALAKMLPRPGMWMETLKQFLAFPMYLTSVWLLWVLGNHGYRRYGGPGARRYRHHLCALVIKISPKAR